MYDAGEREVPLCLSDMNGEKSLFCHVILNHSHVIQYCCHVIQYDAYDMHWHTLSFAVFLLFFLLYAGTDLDTIHVCRCLCVCVGLCECVWV